MGVLSICLTLVVMVFTDISLANPLIEGGMAGRTFSQLNMRCGTTSAFKRITMATPIGGTSQNCEYTIRAYSTRVCQVRIDFTLDLDRPTVTPNRPYAFCADSHLQIDGLSFDLCGMVRSQHVYVPFDAKRITEQMKISFQVKSGSFAAWSMEVNQIECSHRAPLVVYDERQAPDGCLQYFHQPSGRVESFNFGHLYLGNTNYAICFHRGYNDNAILELSEILFEMDSVGTGAAAGFDDDCLTGVGEDPKDYIALPFAEVLGGDPHSLFCGDSLNGQDLTFRGSGPMVIHVNTDRLTSDTYTETGFSFRYRVTTNR